MAKKWISIIICLPVRKKSLKKADELVNLVVASKYSSLIIYYDCLFKEIIINYRNNNTIDKEIIRLCLEIMNSI